jgi:hypothetical protein
MPSGIFNPYAAPKPPEEKKKNFQATTDMKNPYNSEYAPGTVGRIDVSLDGDTYVVVFQNAKVETIAQRLGELMKDLATTHSEELRRYGIDFGSSAPPTASELTLPTPLGVLRVDTGGEKNEVVVYRRLGYALYRMNIAPILKKHAIRVFVRG